METYYIYKITNKYGFSYIGATKNIKDRIYRYQIKSCKTQRLIFDSINEFGWCTHEWCVVEELKCSSKKDVDEREIYWIDYYKSNYNRYPQNKGLNLNDGGTGNSGYKAPQSQLENNSRIKKGNKNWLGKKHSQDTILKFKNKIFTKETKYRMSENCTRSLIILDTTTGVFFIGTPNAAQAYNIKRSTLTDHIKNRCKNKTNLKIV